MSDHVATGLPDLPPSCKLVYRVLEDEARPLTLQEITADIPGGLPDRTARLALQRLQNAGLVEMIPSARGDARKMEYRLAVASEDTSE